jgi:hypothetical protein
MTLEEIEALARKIDESPYHNNTPGESSETRHLALAVLKMLPVVRAAEQHRDNGACYAGILPAVDNMRAAFHQAGARESLINEESAEATGAMTLPALPTERAKALTRLSQAALLHSMAVLRQSAEVLSDLVDLNELSFRRHSGTVDIAATLNGPYLETSSNSLMEAARAFAEADRSESLDNLQEDERDISLRVGGGDPRVGQALVRFIQEVRNMETVHAICAEPITHEGTLRVTTFAHPLNNAREATCAAALKVMKAFPALHFDFNLQEASMSEDGQTVLPNDDAFVLWSAQ